MMITSAGAGGLRAGWEKGGIPVCQYETGMGRFQTITEEDAAPATPADAPVVLALSAAIKDVYRVKAKPKGIGGGTVAAFFRRHGFGAVVWSKIDECAHQPNEYTIIDNMVGDAKVFAHLFMQE